MTTATLGTCNNCGLGINLPHRAPWHPGQRVVVITEDELKTLLTPRSQAATKSDLRTPSDSSPNFHHIPPPLALFSWINPNP